MLKVAVLTSGPLDPSSRFRVRQHIPGLAERGIVVREYTPPVSKYSSFPGWPSRWRGRRVRPLAAAWFGAKIAFRIPGILGSRLADVTWLEREFIAGYPTAEFLVKKPVALDVDDAIWLSPPFGAIAARRLARQCEVLIAGNRYIADWFSGYAKRIEVVPTAVDTRRFSPRPPEESRRGNRFVVGWIGVASNIPSVGEIEKPLASFLQEAKDAELMIVAERPPTFREIPPDRVRFEVWSPDREASLVRDMDVGIMPLADTPWTRGKCSFKMLQYMASGIPVIVSPVGLNADILEAGKPGLPARSEEEWLEALKFFHHDRDIGREFGERGRQLAVDEYDRDRITTRIAEVFNSL